MKTKRISIIVLAAVTIGALCAASAYADSEHNKVDAKNHHRMESAGKEDPFKGLDLTPEQRDKIKTEREANMARMKESYEKMKAKKLELKSELEKPVVDKAKVSSIASELKNISAEKVDQRINSILSLKEILTPEQFKQMNAKMEEKHKEHKGKWEKGEKGEMHGDE